MNHRRRHEFIKYRPTHQFISSAWHLSSSVISSATRKQDTHLSWARHFHFGSSYISSSLSINANEITKSERLPTASSITGLPSVVNIRNLVNSYYVNDVWKDFLAKHPRLCVVVVVEKVAEGKNSKRFDLFSVWWPKGAKRPSTQNKIWNVIIVLSSTSFKSTLSPSLSVDDCLKK